MTQKTTGIFLALLLCGGAGHAQPSVYDAHTEVELVSSVKSVSAGPSLLIGIRFKTDPEWHVYWKNPGDSGMAPDIRWELPPGAAAGDLRWPYPRLIRQPPLASYGYEDEVLLVLPVTIAPDPPLSEALTVRARVRWLACKIECIPGKADLELTLPLAESPVPDERRAALFAKAQAEWPIAVEPGRVRAWISGDTLRIDAVNAPARTVIHFFAEEPLLVRHAEPQRIRTSGGGIRLEVPLSANRPKGLTRLQGVLVSEGGWRGARSEKALAVSVPLESAPPRPSMGFWTALGFAFVGGLILNLMPCVLPVLSLKILGFVREAAESRRALWVHGLLFTAGVLVSFWALAAVLWGLQAAGRQIGWGFQLQQPVFLIALAALFIFFALNLLGFFEIGTGLAGAGQSLTRRRGLAGAFFNGAFATIVATPCTAPFMGAAMGYTLTQPAWISFLVFTALGLGLSAPYLLLCAYPAFLKGLPKPGPWMDVFKKCLSVPLLATAAWLGWILWIQVGPAAQPQAGRGIAWETFSEERLETLLDENRAVFIDFTAAWCLTCQVNERVALERRETAELFRKKGIVPLKADWTSQDARIAQALARYGRNSIPLYVYYAAGSKEAELLPEVLTVDLVKKALED